MKSSERSGGTLLLGAFATVFSLFSGLAEGQQVNGVHGTLNVNSTASGAAPYAAAVQTTESLAIAVQGSADMPYVLFTGPLAVGNLIYPGAVGQLDIGPTRNVIANGYTGTLNERIFANTGTTGTSTLCAAVPPSFAPSGPVSTAFQAVVVDFAFPPYFISITAATNVTVSPIQVVSANAGCDKTCLTGQSGVQLDGSASVATGSLGTITYQWTYLGTIPGVTITNATSAQATFTAPSATTLVTTLVPQTASTMTFQLSVSNGTVTDVDTVDVFVRFSFTGDVNPIWTNFSCDGCHSSPGPSGNLDLAGTASQNYAALFATANVTGQQRVNLTTPAASLILTKPGINIPNDLSHSGGSSFNGVTDPQYLTMLTWIQQGAANN